jgi:hypothetical protein
MKTARVCCCSTLLLVALAASAQQPPKGRTNRTRVVLLGTGQPAPDPDRSGPAILDRVWCVALRRLFSTGTLPHLSPPT